MMEEANDEQPEMVTHEEAAEAEREATANIQLSPNNSPLASGALGAPSPLPSFLSKTTSASSPGMPTTPTVTSKTTPPMLPSISPPLPAPSTPVSSHKHVSISSPIVHSAPESLHIPHGDSAPDSPVDSKTNSVRPQVLPGSGLFGWISSNSLVNRVVEKTKTSMETMITTLDPGMKAVMHSGGEIEVTVTSAKEDKVVPIRESFQSVFGRATVTGIASQATTAAQPVGFTAGLKGAEERITNLRKSGSVPDGQAVVSVEGFIVEILPDRWFEMSVLLLRDPSHGVELQTFSQPTLIPNEYILKAQDKTPSDYPLKWAGMAVTIGAVIEDSHPHIGHADWQKVLCGVSRKQSLQLAAHSLAYMYKERLPTSFVS